MIFPITNFPMVYPFLSREVIKSKQGKLLKMSTMVIFMCKIKNFVIFMVVISQQKMSYFATKHKIFFCSFREVSTKGILTVMDYPQKLN